MQIILVAAVAENWVIGNDGGMPWHAPNEFKFFRNLTRGKCLLMGHATWRSIGRPLPERTTVVVSRNPDLQLPDTEVYNSIESALDACRARQLPELMVLGGAEIYRQTIGLADQIIISRLKLTCAGDRHFPALGSSLWPEQDWHLESRQDGLPGEIEYVVETYRRIGKS